tara:strand:- start:112260 stop:113060 length:801 start_codon:yes stop_codon:yes gene_type:complete
MKSSKRIKNHALVVKVSAWSYLILALLYPIFTLSAMSVDTASVNLVDFLTGLSSSGITNKIVLTIFAVIPALLITGGVGFYSAVKPYSYKLSGVSLIFTVFAAVGFIIGIGRWPSLNWGLGEAFVQYKNTSEYILSFYNISNHMLGYWIGQVFAEISLFTSIGVMSIVMFNSKRFPVWLCGFASVIFILGVAATFRNMSEAALWTHSFISSFMLVPIFFILLSIALFRFVGKSKEKPIGNYAKKKFKNIKKPKEKKVKKKKAPKKS